MNDIMSAESTNDIVTTEACNRHTACSPTEVEVRNMSTGIPRGYHRPPSGYTDIANQYLWNDDDSFTYMPYNASLWGYRDSSSSGSEHRIVFKSPFTQNVSNTAQTSSTSPASNFTSNRPNETSHSLPDGLDATNVTTLGTRVFMSSSTVILILKKCILYLITFFKDKKYVKKLIFGVMTLVCVGNFIHSLMSMQRSQKRRHQIQMYILNRNISSIDVFSNKDSPQNDAMNWLTNSDVLRLEPFDESIFVRYSLAVFYFSMTNIDGTIQWDNSNTWLSELDICLWSGIICDISNTSEVIGLTIGNVRGQLPVKELSTLVSKQMTLNIS